MNRAQKDNRVWAKVGADRRELEALRTAAKNFLAGNTTEQAVAEFKAALAVNNADEVNAWLEKAGKAHN